ncbi:hypothetical protein CC86DRAFT_256812, partial [Ophiobolus disseminans]
IRLLRLDPGVADARISCSLEIVDDFSASPRYHAISYCWGDEKNRTRITCNDGTLLVTENLHAAFLRLRQQQESILVWADAVCINQ